MSPRRRPSLFGGVPGSEAGRPAQPGVPFSPMGTATPVRATDPTDEAPMLPTGETLTQLKRRTMPLANPGVADPLTELLTLLARGGGGY